MFYRYMILIIAVSTTLAYAESPSALIQRQYQEFSDASASGNRIVLDRLLDDHVIFINENGEIATKQDLLESASPPKKGISNTLTQIEFTVQIHGDTAVTKFIDVANIDFHGQKLTNQFLSTEVWYHEKQAWRMISSQTLALQNDPPAVTLPAARLDNYVGRYQAGSDFTYRITRIGSVLMGAANGAKPNAMRAELTDVFFTPGQPRARKIFQRDPAGKITGFVIRREGRDVQFRRIG